MNSAPDPIEDKIDLDSARAAILIGLGTALSLIFVAGLGMGLAWLMYVLIS